MSRPLIFRDTVESTSSNPYLSGFIEIEADGHSVRLRWEGETEWKKLEWCEAVVIASGFPAKLLEEGLEDERDKARQEMYLMVAQEAAALDDAVYKKGYKDGFAAGQKVIQLK